MQLAKARKNVNGRWYFTASTRYSTYAIGGCRQHNVCPDCSAYLFGSPEQLACGTCLGKGLIDRPDACSGHDDKEGAIAHYQQWLAENATFHKGAANPKTLHLCSVTGCKEHTAGYAALPDGGMSFIFMCDTHRTVEHLRPLVTVRESYTS